MRKKRAKPRAIVPVWIPIDLSGHILIHWTRTERPRQATTTYGDRWVKYVPAAPPRRKTRGKKP